MAWRAANVIPSDRPPTLADLRHVLEAHFAIVWEYRFYYRELPMLLRRDARSARAYREVRREGLAIAGTIKALGYALWSLWLIGAGIAVLRAGTHRAPARLPADKPVVLFDFSGF